MCEDGKFIECQLWTQPWGRLAAVSPYHPSLCYRVSILVKAEQCVLTRATGPEGQARAFPHKTLPGPLHGPHLCASLIVSRVSIRMLAPCRVAKHCQASSCRVEGSGCHAEAVPAFSVYQIPGSTGEVHDSRGPYLQSPYLLKSSFGSGGEDKCLPHVPCSWVY